MLLKVIVDDQQLTLNVPDVIVEGAQDFFAQMDRDMDAGWQMGREWVDHLDVQQRCQVVADKLLTALETENEKLGRMIRRTVRSSWLSAARTAVAGTDTTATVSPWAEKNSSS